MDNIGHKLARLQNEMSSNSYLEGKESKKNIEQLNKQNNSENLPRNPQIIPNQICSIHNSFLANNFDFFYKYIFGQSEDKVCLKLFTHLNSCYSCFSVFSQTMRDFFHKKNEMTINAKGVAE